jgi:hypothetical protein
MFTLTDWTHKKQHNIWRRVRPMVFNSTFNNISDISWRSVVLVEETGVLRENNRPAASHAQTLSHNVVSSTLRHNSNFLDLEMCTSVVLSFEGDIIYHLKVALSIIWRWHYLSFPDQFCNLVVSFGLPHLYLDHVNCLVLDNFDTWFSMRFK